MPNPVKCDQCGADIPPSSRGLCPACLMRQGFAPTASEQLELDNSRDPAVAFDVTRSYSGASTRPKVDLAAGVKFGSHRIVRKLGSGGMGTVYEADHITSGRRVALKVLTHSLESGEAKSRFLREGRLAASVNHPNSVYVFGTEEVDGTPTISMELVSGGTLEDKVRSQGPLSVGDAVDAVLQIIDGLEAAEQKGVLHRDIKPANCFIDPTGTVKVGDFGLSISTMPREQWESSQVTREGSFLGTPAFASPEQLRGDQLDARSDIYSVGVTLFYLLTGHPPFTANNMVQLLATVLDKPAPKIRDINNEVPHELAQVIDRCLAKSAGSRAASYAALRNSLLPFSNQTPIPALLGQRFLAGIVDYGCIHVLTVMITILLWAIPSSWLYEEGTYWMSSLTIALASIAYFTFAESRWGTTIGKYLLGLRVVQGQSIPTVNATLVRALIYVGATTAPRILMDWSFRANDFQMNPSVGMAFLFAIIANAPFWMRIVLFSTARRSNGGASIYDLLTGVRVVERPGTAVEPEFEVESDRFLQPSNDQHIGPYSVLEHLGRVAEHEELVLAYDTQLLRRVWLHLLPPSASSVPQTVRNLSRATRLRWLGEKRSEEQTNSESEKSTEVENWDCYEALEGRPLCEVIRDLNDWRIARRALKSLCHELKAGLVDGTVPKSLSSDRLWVTRNGAIKLLPFSAPNPSRAVAPLAAEFQSTASNAEDRCVEFVSRAANFLVEKCRLVKGEQRAGVPASAISATAELATATNFDQVTSRVSQLTKEIASVSRRRLVAIVGTTFGVPLLLFLGAILSNAVMYQQSLRHPQLNELSQDLIALYSLRSVNNLNKNHQEDIRQFELFIAGQYQQLIHDDSRWQSPYARLTISGARRADVESMVSRINPTEDELTAARQHVKAWKLGRNYTSSINRLLFQGLSGACFVSLAVWVQFIWLPSLLTGALYRGGAILRGYGVALVNQENQPASRTRVFLRMLIPGSLVLLLVILQLATRHSSFWIQTPGTVSFIVVIVATTLTLSSLYFGRSLSDRLAGTYLVPR